MNFNNKEDKMVKKGNQSSKIDSMQEEEDNFGGEFEDEIDELELDNEF